MPPVIDAHVHVWTDDRTRYPRADGAKDYAPARFTPGDLFVHTRPAGVTQVVLIQMSFYRFDNSYMLDMMRAHPGVFGGVGIVDAHAPDPVAAMRRLAQQGVRGFRIVSGAPQWLDGPGMQAMWRAGAQDRLALCPLLVSPADLASLDRMCQAHPDTPVVIDHFARIGADGKIVPAQVQALCALARHRQVKVKVSALYALGQKKAPYHDLAPMFRRLLESYGARRLMWASDCPFQVAGGHQYPPSIDFIRQMPMLSNDDREWILGRTAEETFFAK
jgi:predicted TIM-barrel fold metal-dependent hydrolase